MHIVRRVNCLNKSGNILTHWSVAQAGSNDKKIEVENLVRLSLEN